MRIRTTSIVSFFECPYRFYLKEVAGVREKKFSYALPWGSAVHRGIERVLLDDGDPVEAFNQEWEKARLRDDIEYPSSGLNSWKKCKDLGERLVRQFAEKWPSFGLSVAWDLEGPLIERKFEKTYKIQLGDRVVELTITGHPDVICFDENGELVVLDFKTASSPHDSSFALWADQLTLYQELVGPSLEAQGFPSVTKLGFLELIKRIREPQVLPPALYPARGEEHKKDLAAKLGVIGFCIATGSFPRTARYAYNSPCNLCGVAEYCRAESN